MAGTHLDQADRGPQPRLVAIEGGGDWADASVNYVKVPFDCDLTQAKKDYREWYTNIYGPAIREAQTKARTGDRSPFPTYLSFIDWLATRCGAERNPSEIEVFYDE